MSNPTTQFKPGESGNPNGRPKGAKSFTTKVREALEKIADGEEYTYEEALIKSVLKKAIIDGDVSTQRLIWNYLDGLPMQKTDITSGGEKLIPIYGGNSIQKHNSNTEDISVE